CRPVARSAAADQKVPANGGLPQRRQVHPVQQGWSDYEVPPCGYWHSGQIRAAGGLLGKNRHPSDKDIDAAMTNICRCGTYARIRTAIHAAAKTLKSTKA